MRESFRSLFFLPFNLTFLKLFDTIREIKSIGETYLKVEKETVELNSETIPQLLEKLYKSQNHVLVRINGTVILDLLNLDGLKKLLITKVYPHVTVVYKSYGYELSVPPSIER